MFYKITIILALIFLFSLLVLPQRTSSTELQIVSSPNIKVYAFEKVLDRWGESEWASFSELVQRESRWKSEAKNPLSSAYGIFQFLDSTWSTVGCKKTSDKFEQVNCGIKYIEKNYQTPSKALKFQKSKGWY